MDKFIQDLARRAGRVLQSRFGKTHTVRAKAHATDVVTEADLAAEHLIKSAIRRGYPSHGIVAEESGHHRAEAEYVWYVDPLDGTFNFSKGTPLFCTMIGLVHEKRPLLCAIYIPTFDYLYFAKANKGAFLNNQRVHCSTQKTLANSYGCGPTHFRRPETIAVMERLLKQSYQTPFWMSGLGSAGVHAAFTTSGVRDWYISTRSGECEVPTMALMLKESGCVVTNKDGQPWRLGDTSVIAVNKYLQPQLLRLVQGGR